MKRHVNRSAWFLGLLILALILAACAQPAAAPAPAPAAQAPAAKATEAPKAPAPAPTQAPPAAAPVGKPQEAPTAAPKAQPTAAPKAAPKGGKLVWGDPSEMDTMDPGCSFSTWADNQRKHVYDTLVFWAPDLNFYPNLAKSWEISPDLKTYTFKLRDDVKFHDGTPFNAEAVKVNLERLGKDKCTVGKTAVGLLGSNYEGTDAVDATTVRIRFKAANPAFLASAAYLYIASPAAMTKFGDDFGRNPVGTGPYRFKEWVDKSHFTVVRNPDYNWAPTSSKHQGPALLEEITWRFIVDNATRLASLEKGEVDFINRVDFAEFAQLQKSGKFTLTSRSVPGVVAGWNFNTKLPPTDDIRVRQAIGYAIDRQSLNNTLSPGFNKMAFGPLTSATWGYWPGVEQYAKYNLDQAKKLLDEAGWKPGPDGIRVKDGQKMSLTLNSVGTAGWKEGWEFAQAQLREIGIQLAIDITESGVAVEVCHGAKKNICAIRWGLRDPVDMQILWSSANIGKGFNWTHLKDDEIDRLLAAGASEPDREKRAKHYQDLQKRIMDLALWLPMWDTPSVFATKPTIKDYTVLPAGTHVYLYDAYVDQ